MLVLEFVLEQEVLTISFVIDVPTSGYGVDHINITEVETFQTTGVQKAHTDK
jgi:hypothetical protein